MTTKTHHNKTASPSSNQNAHRAGRAYQVLRNYTDECDMRANLVDLLSDIQHYCRQAQASDPQHPSFEEVLVSARNHFRTETSEE